MSNEIKTWPSDMLVPGEIHPNITPFSRSGGTTLGGISRATRTDRGWWEISYVGVPLKSKEERRKWNALRVHASGMAGLIEIPVYSLDSFGIVDGVVDGNHNVPHSDGSAFSDLTRYSQPSLSITMVAEASIGETEIALLIDFGLDDPSGTRFSYEGALYEIGYAVEDEEESGLWVAMISPSIRATIPEGAALEFSDPTCIVRLATDSEMDVKLSAGRLDLFNVNFIEAVDYWNELASEEETS